MPRKAAPRPRPVLVAALGVFLVAPAAVAAVGLHGGSASGPPSANAARAPAPPSLAAPRGGAHVGAAPAFSWRRVRRAQKYRFQLSADRGFRSIVANGSFETRNTFATVDRALPEGTYHWRVRAIDARERAGGWSSVRSLVKRWATPPALIAPSEGAPITYPRTPLVLRWEPVPHAFKYLVTIATDPSLASPVIGTASRPVETVGTALALPGALAPGRYYWAVTPLDARLHRGTQSRVGSFVWSWPSQTATRVTDLNDDQSVYDPQFSWDRVPGAARYEVEVNSSQDFAVGSRVCCADRTTGTSLSPTRLLPNNTYYWRVRAFDVDGNAGVWNLGSSFLKGFDNVTPTIPNLRLRDNASDPAPGPGVPATSAPIVAWDPVPGASSYEVQLVPHALGGCNWGSTGSETWGVPTPIGTASTAWTPLASSVTGNPVPFSDPVAFDPGKALQNGHSYCARVRARAATDTEGNRVVSDWTQVGGSGTAAFSYVAPPAPNTGPLYMSSSDYRLPAAGSLTTRMPLFTWKAVAGACGYFVAVARDAAFTDVIDVARTVVPAYAPRPRSYPDETTSYHWAVLPVNGSPCDDVFTTPQENSPKNFEKRSTPPSPLGPAEGADVSAQPTFRWTAAEGAREYRLQVAADPSFGNLIDDVRTAATAFTSSSTYPSDSRLYWRVRANDENGIGLTWSPVRTFRRRLPAPAVGPNPTAGETVPVLTWSPVPGAVSYDFFTEQPDGVKRAFNVRSTAATFVQFYGTGAFRWQVRANFPRAAAGVTSSAYSPPRSFVRYIGGPTGARSTSSSKRLVVNWDPSFAGTKQYRVQFSESNSFGRVILDTRTDNTSYAPQLIQPGFLDGGRIYWRVAAVDEGSNVGGWASGRVAVARRMVVRVRGLLRRGKPGAVRVVVTDAKGRRIKRARVTARGAGIRARVRRTGKRGIATFRLRPRARGRVSFRVDKRGFRPGLARLRVY